MKINETWAGKDGWFSNENAVQHRAWGKAQNYSCCRCKFDWATIYNQGRRDHKNLEDLWLLIALQLFLYPPLLRNWGHNSETVHQRASFTPEGAMLPSRVQAKKWEKKSGPCVETPAKEQTWIYFKSGCLEEIISCLQKRLPGLATLLMGHSVASGVILATLEDRPWDSGCLPSASSHESCAPQDLTLPASKKLFL